MTKYIVIEEPIKGFGDRFEFPFDALKEANDWGKSRWKCTTAYGKKHHHIYVVSVEDTEDYLEDYAWSDDGVDYTLFHSADIEDDYFDSERSEINDSK